MRYLIIIACLLVSSFGHAHMSTYNEEFAAHHMSSGGDNWGQAVLSYRAPGGMWGYEYNVNIESDKWYVLLNGNVNNGISVNGVNFLDNPLDMSLLHDIKLTDQNDCFSLLRYLGYIYNAPVENINDPNDGVYTLVYTSYFNQDPISSLSYTMTYDDVNAERTYDIYAHTYVWVYDSSVDTDYPTKTYLGIQDSPPVSILRKKSVYDSYVQKYLYVYDYYKSWNDVFTATEYLNAVIADDVSGEYAFATPVVCDYGSTYSYLTLKILGVFSRCGSTDTWTVTLGALQGGKVNRVSGWTRYPWEIWLKPTFSGAELVKIYEWSGYSETSFSKSKLVQDETVYTSGGVDYQGTAYWEVRVTYLGQSYRLRLYGSDPPCSGNIFDGDGKSQTGYGLKLKGQGGKHSGMGGYEKNRIY